MSPISSSSAGDHHNQRSISAQRTRRQLKLPDSDENRPSRSLESSPFPLQQDIGKTHRTKPLKENGQHRLDTPTLPPPSRSRLNQQRLLTSSSAATRLLRLSVSSEGDEDQSKALSRSLSSSLCEFKGSVKNVVGLSLPPVAPNAKITKKQKEGLSQQSDVHSLKLLYNRYLQWRFVNAKAKITTQSQQAQAERMFYSLGMKMSELSDSVQKKRIELQRLLRVKAVTEIVESQNPCLERWTVIEEEYLSSLSETTEALLNASLRLPLDVDIKVENNELAETLVVASKSMEGIVANIGSLVPKTEEMEILVSELARVSSREKAFIEDCGVSLLKTHSSQIEECYLRSQLIQHQKNCNLQLLH